MLLFMYMVAFDCVYNKETTENACLYWKDSKDIIEIMKNNTKDFDSIAKQMNQIGSKEYAWKNIAEKYNSLY